MAQGNGPRPASDPKFRGLVLTLENLWSAGFRGKVTLDMDGCGSVRLKAEPPSVEITGETAARLMIMGETVRR